MSQDDWNSKDFVAHWKYYLVPARPTSSELEFIEKKIRAKGKNVKILVLGSTPEYRDMCGNIGIPLTLMDFSRRNYEYLAQDVMNIPKEDFIEGNWITTKPDHKFDIILGDHSLNVISKKDLSQMLSNVSNMLKKDGLFMPRTNIRITPDRLNPEQVIKDYRERRFIYGIVPGTMINLFLAGYNAKEDAIIFREIYNMVLKLYGKKLITQKELDYYGECLGWRIFPEWRMFMPIKDEFEKEACKIFDIEELFWGKEEYLTGNCPVYVLKVK